MNERLIDEVIEMSKALEGSLKGFYNKGEIEAMAIELLKVKEMKRANSMTSEKNIEERGY